MLWKMSVVGVENLLVSLKSLTIGLFIMELFLLPAVTPV
jgi:hypothetical protein